MAIRNESGDAVDYEVQPSDPGPPNASAVRNATGNALLFSSMGTALAGVGCLTDFGDQALVLVGLGFLVVGLVFLGVAFDRARRLATDVRALRLVRSTGRTLLVDGDEHAHTFTPGTWVEFWSRTDPAVRLAQSPVIDKPSAVVILRRCPSSAQALSGAGSPPADAAYYVHVQ